MTQLVAAMPASGRKLRAQEQQLSCTCTHVYVRTYAHHSYESRPKSLTSLIVNRLKESRVSGTAPRVEYTPSRLASSSIRDAAPPARVASVINKGIEDGWHTGAQLFVAVGGEIIINTAFGHSSPDVLMSTHTRLPWACAAKPLVAVAIAQLVEAGVATWSDCLISWIPELAGRDKDEITIEDLLAYRAGIPGLSSCLGREAAIAEIASSTLEYKPRSDCRYDQWTSWFLLGEILRRADGLELVDVLRRRICDRIGMTLVAGPLSSVDDATLYDTAREPPREVDWYDTAAPEWAFIFIRAPISDLGRFYLKLTDGKEELIAERTLQVMLEPRVGDMPWSLGGPPSPLRWGLGFSLGYHVYLPRCSHDSFGHFGGEISVALVDRERHAVIAFAANGMPGNLKSWVRTQEVTNAIFAACEW